MKSVVYLGKQILLSFVININNLFILEIIIFLAPRKVLHFIIKLKVSKNWNSF